MKVTSILAAAALATVATAQTIDDLPPCAFNCLITLLPTSCGVFDFACSCANKDFIALSTICVRNACSEADRLLARDITMAICRNAGVPIEIPLKKRSVRRM